MIKAILVVFILLLLLREISAWNSSLRLKYFFTPLVTITVVILPVISISRYGLTQYNVAILASLLLALAADTLLMIEEVNLLKSGLVFFLGGHMFYVIAFSGNASFRLWNVAVIIVLVLLNFNNIKKIRAKAGKLFPAVMLYTLLINVMIFLAVAGLNSGFTMQCVSVAAGAVLFAVSDYILSRNTFVEKIPHSTVYTWAFYAPAQFLIALSTLYIC